MRRILMLVLAPLLVLGLAGTAQASYTSTNPTTTTPGSAAKYQFGGFLPGSTTTLTFTRTDVLSAGAGGPGFASVVLASSGTTITRTVTADSSGNASAVVSLPSEGTWRITATGTGTDGQPRTVSQVVTVDDGNAANNASSGGSLARTGAETGLYVAAGIGLVLLAAGITVVVSLRRRRAPQLA